MIDTSKLDDFSLGFFLGLIVGEGHFGGDGRQPQITLRMHVKHEKLFRWLERMIPEGKLYGPYNHGGRAYFQWMLRGPALREAFAPLIAQRLIELDDHARSRFLEMCSRYKIDLPV